MHPIIIMSYDKSPAIMKAVAALEEAGLEVRVLNTGHAKLADFLGALAGDEDDEELAAVNKEADTDEADESTDDAKAAPIATEALVDGEIVQVQLVEGSFITLHPSSIVVGARTVYELNESKFAFWPDAVSNEPITEGVVLKFEEHDQMQVITLSESTATPPVLKIGKEWLKEAAYPKHSSWAVLPATQPIFDKSKVTPDEVLKELGRNGNKVAIVKRTTDSYPEKVTYLMMPAGSADRVGDKNKAHHDQNFGRLGTFEVMGHLVKTDDDWTFDGKDVPGLDTPEKIKKFKAPVYVFK